MRRARSHVFCCIKLDLIKYLSTYTGLTRYSGHVNYPPQRCLACTWRRGPIAMQGEFFHSYITTADQ